MDYELLVLFVSVVLLAGLIGYAWGRRTGFEQGERLGRSMAPLRLRQQLLEEDRCPVCQQPVQRPPGEQQ